MWAWLRGKGPADYQVPPAEASVVSRREALAGVDIRLSELAGIPPWARSEEQWDELDRLLDRRARLAREVPVVSGRVESIVENYQENPW